MLSKNKIIISGAFITLVILIGIGLLFQKSEEEKAQGLSNHYDVSEDYISYVKYEEGKPILYLYHLKEGTKEKIVEFDNDKFIDDPTFTHDGKQIAFIMRNKNSEEDESSIIYQFDVKTKKSEELFRSENLVTELAFSPNDEILFFLQAGIFTNYSPIAEKRPHDFDIFSYHLAEKEINQLTHLQTYHMGSLEASLNGESLYVQMIDDITAESEEEIFETRQKIFQIPLEAPEEMNVFFESSRDVDIYDFTFTPDGKELIFQSISNPDTAETFIYELYTLNLETKDEKQLTNVNIYCEKPVVSNDGKTLYFIVDKKFGKRSEDYHLYKMNRENGQIFAIEDL